MLALVSHLLATFGFPLPAPKKGSSQPFPCQNRPCGCLTYDACWAGDCCCFTIEEKLRWAEENGIEVPTHVRPLIESRKSRPAPPPKKKKSCCSEAEPAPEPTPAPTCCEKGKPAAPTCCAEKASCAAGTATAGCPECAPKSASKCCEQKSPREAHATDRSGVRWVAGVFAQKCRGEGPAGLFLLDPGIAPDLTPIVLPEPERPVHPAPRSDRTTPTSHCPPTPPPRQF
ncbi:hypothetical protein [Frigoriglobus tundricola]|uniref:hypothetical protein n=1 Tax=Frigoriglobus tundricola TaxID=2774151 RepID=UPI00148EB743|nr:hypothetical protein [Frigoriglobus tundricola]